VVTRLVICPIVLFSLFAAAEALQLPVLASSQDPVLRLLVLLESCSPSGQSVLLLCQLHGNTRAAKDLSLLYVAMYPLSLLTMTVALAVAMQMVFG
jgi:hypothetical protein